jgi:phosphatidylinositol dimannoside acyltransferase
VSPRARAVETITYLGYRAMHRFVPLLPTRTGRAIFVGGGRLLFRLLPRKRAIVAANQAQVLGRPADDPLVQASTREAFALYARYWFDSFNVLSWSDEQVVEAFRFANLDLVEKGLANGKGVVIGLPHMSNWDVGGRAMAIRAAPLVSVAEHLEPEELFRLFLEHRRELRMDIIDLATPHVGRQLSGRLEKNRIVALVADRDLTGGGVEVEMFGRARRMPAGPAMLSLATGAPLLAAQIVTTPDGWTLTFREISIEPTGRRKDDIRELTQALATAFETGISAAPSDWHLFQPAWEP